MMVIDAKYNFGDTVYLKTDPDQYARIVTEFKVSPGQVLYEVSCGDKASYHYDFELSVNEDKVLKTK